MESKEGKFEYRSSCSDYCGTCDRDVQSGMSIPGLATRLDYDCIPAFICDTCLGQMFALIPMRVPA